MSPRPIDAGSVAENIYEGLAPIAGLDEVNDWHLLIYIGALGRMFQLVEDLVRDTDEGPGWSSVVDGDRIPAVALPWTAQLVGGTVRRNVNESDGDFEARARPLIKEAKGFKRGTVAAIRAAAQEHLTGTKTVTITERDGDAYAFTVATLTGETPSQAAVLRALRLAKPAGLIMTYGTFLGQNYGQLESSYATYGDVENAYINYDAVRQDAP